MACSSFTNYWFTINQNRIEKKNTDAEWYTWFDQEYMALDTKAQSDFVNKISTKALRDCFESKKAAYNNTKSVNEAKCLPTSNETVANNQYKQECVSRNANLQQTLNRFYNTKSNSVANYTYMFNKKRDLAQGEINEISNIINSFPTALTDINTQIKNKQDEIANVDTEIKALEDKTNAYEQQFVEDKAKFGKTVEKKKLNVLQDYLLAAFFISYLFFALIAIFYVTKINDYSWSIFAMMVLLAVLIGGLMAAVINYIA